MNKRTVAAVLSAILILGGCGGQKQLEGENKSIDRANEASSGYVTEMALSNADDGLKLAIENGDTLLIKGRIGSSKYAMIEFGSGYSELAALENGYIDHSFKLPDGLEEAGVDIFIADEEYGTYKSYMTDWIRLLKKSDKWTIMSSPVSESNRILFYDSKDPEDYLEPESGIGSDELKISSLALDITRNCTNDYEKLRAIHDWMTENIYYDYDALRTGETGECDSLTVLSTKKSVCEGYANLTAALLRSIGIPCRKTRGFALGIGYDHSRAQELLLTETSNHTWNEAYADGRWIVLDTTWDTDNKYENGIYQLGETRSDLYFDPTIEFLSLTRRIIKE